MGWRVFSRTFGKLSQTKPALAAERIRRLGNERFIDMADIIREE